MLANVIVVVVTYNRKKLLKESIEALLAQSYKDCAVIIVDNASDDGTYEEVNNLIDNKKVLYFNTGDNLGGAGGFNYGVKKAIELGSNYIWLMDDDCIVKEDSLQVLVEEANKRNDNFGFLASKVLWTDGTMCEMNIPRITMTKNLSEYDLDNQKVFMSSFVSLFIRSEIVKELGYPIKDFFIWTDDWEYTRRISRKYLCYYVPESEVIHKTNNKFGAKIENANSDNLDRFSYLYRNDVYLYSREGLKGYIYMFLRVLYHSYKVLKSDKDKKLKRIGIIINSTLKGLSFKPEIEKNF